VRGLIIAGMVAVAVGASAETIHLKNGRTIVAERVHQTAAHLEYDIGDNSYAIPKSLVDHLESGGVPITTAGTSSSATEKASDDVPAFTPSVSLDGSKLSVSVIKDGQVDTSILDSLDRSGNAQLAATGYFLAGRREDELGHRDQAQRYFNHALRLSPDDPAIVTHYAASMLQSGNYRQASDAAERATRLAPSSADAFSVLGFAQFLSNKSESAVQSWKRSLALRPDPLVQQYLAKAQRELNAEANFSEHETGHFTLRYEGRQTSDSFRRELLDTLETHYNDLDRDLDVSPRENIPVVLYTGQAFFDVTQAPSWTSAMYDGKMRIPVSGLTGMTPELARVLKHELAHAFINQESHGRCPQWLHEGIAQLVEPRDSTRFGRRLGHLISAQQALPFNQLEGSFMHFSAPEATLAYDESLAAAEYLRDTYGMSDLRRILERLAQGSSTEAALRATVHSDYGQFETDLGKFLQKKYGE
jgi:tetratricopeptide (TPR) repeat protein